MVGVEWFGYSGIHTCRKSLCIVFNHAVGRERYNRNVALQHLPNINGGFIPIHYGHVQVHQYDVELVFLQQVDGLLAIERTGYHGAQFAEHQLDDALVQRIVLDDQNPYTFDTVAQKHRILVQK